MAHVYSLCWTLTLPGWKLAQQGRPAQAIATTLGVRLIASRARTSASRTPVSDDGTK